MRENPFFNLFPSFDQPLSLSPSLPPSRVTLLLDSLCTSTVLPPLLSLSLSRRYALVRSSFFILPCISLQKRTSTFVLSYSLSLSLSSIQFLATSDQGYLMYPCRSVFARTRNKLRLFGQFERKKFSHESFTLFAWFRYRAQLITADKRRLKFKTIKLTVLRNEKRKKHRMLTNSSTKLDQNFKLEVT